MKLASLNDGRDGRLVAVSRDLTQAISAHDIAPTLQAALDSLDICAPKLRDLCDVLKRRTVPSFRFREHDAAAPRRTAHWSSSRAKRSRPEP
jgi:fumarylacetoacetate (FAA) hydrolase